jgi:TonB family protein
MKHPPFIVRRCAFGLLFLGLVAASRGQDALYVQDGDMMALVVDAHGPTPLILKEGKPVSATSGRYSLRKAPEYFPEYVSVDKVTVKDSYLESSNNGQDINHTFNFYGEFASAYRIDHAFIALELIQQNGKKGIFVHEVGAVGPGAPQVLQLALPFSGFNGETKYALHVFDGGREVLQSLIPFDFREHILDQMVASRVAKSGDGPPSPFICAPPVYPKSLSKAKISGDVMLHFRISTRGSVLDPQVLSASDPAFGASAIEAVRMWRFLPLVKGGKAVEIPVAIPVHFAP